MVKSAIIFGITGQDGSYLTELLISKGYEVHGAIRRSSTWSTGRLDHLYADPHEPSKGMNLHHADMLDATSLETLLAEVQPDEIYNLAAQSHVAVSFAQPELTLSTSVMGTLRVLEAMRRVCPRAKLYHAGSSEMFGLSPPPQCETTPFMPCSPYGVAKLAAHELIRVYRTSYKLWACSGILFNHESSRRGESFVSRKITMGIGRIVTGAADKIYLGNLSARRDWGHAKDYVRAMWLMLQQDNPKDYVIATGEAYSVMDFCRIAFGLVGLDWSKYVVVDPRYVRPMEVPALQGDATMASVELGWEPGISFENMILEMVTWDIGLAQRRKLVAEAVESGAVAGLSPHS